MHKILDSENVDHILGVTCNPVDGELTSSEIEQGSPESGTMAL